MRRPCATAGCSRVVLPLAHPLNRRCAGCAAAVLGLAMPLAGHQGDSTARFHFCAPSTTTRAPRRRRRAVPTRSGVVVGPLSFSLPSCRTCAHQHHGMRLIGGRDRSDSRRSSPSKVKAYGYSHRREVVPSPPFLSMRYRLLALRRRRRAPGDRVARRALAHLATHAHLIAPAARLVGASLAVHVAGWASRSGSAPRRRATRRAAAARSGSPASPASAALLADTASTSFAGLAPPGKAHRVGRGHALAGSRCLGPGAVLPCRSLCRCRAILRSLSRMIRGATAVAGVACEAVVAHLAHR